MAGKAYWTIEKVVETIRQIMRDMEIDHLPRYLDLKERVSLDANTLKRFGGYKNISMLMGVPIAPKRTPGRYNKPAKTVVVWDELDPWNGRPSRAFEIEREARERGLHYADIQEKSYPVKVDTGRYAGLKSWAERQAT